MEDESLPHFKKGHGKGDIISVAAEKPKLHSGEDTRWDFKVTIIFKNATLAFDPELTTPCELPAHPRAMSGLLNPYAQPFGSC
jgi:hypothetical protein